MECNYEYPWSVLGRDYFRSLFGTIVSMYPLIFLDIDIVFFLLLLGTTILFLILLLRTLQKQVTTVTLTDELLNLSNLFEVTVYWDQLTEMSVSYFSTWRGGGNGWMEMKLKGAGRAIKIESSLQGFLEIVERAIKSAKGCGLALDSATISNLESIGVEIGAIRSR